MGARPKYLRDFGMAEKNMLVRVQGSPWSWPTFPGSFRKTPIALRSRLRATSSRLHWVASVSSVDYLRVDSRGIQVFRLVTKYSLWRMKKILYWEIWVTENCTVSSVPDNSTTVYFIFYRFRIRENSSSVFLPIPKLTLSTARTQYAVSPKK